MDKQGEWNQIYVQKVCHIRCFKTMDLVHLFHHLFKWLVLGYVELFERLTLPFPLFGGVKVRTVSNSWVIFCFVHLK